MTVETTIGERGTERDVSNAVIDSDGHVQEQLTLPPDLMVEIMQRIGADFEAMTAAGAGADDPFPMEGSGPPTLQTIAGGWDPLARLVSRRDDARTRGDQLGACRGVRDRRRDQLCEAHKAELGCRR